MLTCAEAGAAKNAKDRKKATESAHFFICLKLAFGLKKRPVAPAIAIVLVCIAVKLV